MFVCSHLGYHSLTVPSCWGRLQSLRLFGVLPFLLWPSITKDSHLIMVVSLVSFALCLHDQAVTP